MKKSRIVWLLAGIMLLVLLLAPYASQAPDGLGRVAEDKGFAGMERSASLPAPADGYVLPGIAQPALATGLAGALGILAVFGGSYGLGKLLHLRQKWSGSGPERKEASWVMIKIDNRIKVIGSLAMVLTVVLTPARAFEWFAAYTVLLGVLMLILRVSPGYALKRSLVVVPLVLLAALPTPFLQKGPESLVAFYGPGHLAVYQYGLLIFWNALIKAWLSVQSMTLLAATTPVPALLAALQQLKAPRALVSQIALIHRYGNLFTEELARMRRAAESRNFGGSRSYRLKVIGQLIGSLFLRSYERGERVHAAMVARGYDGAGALAGRPGSVMGSPGSAKLRRSSIA